MPVTFIIAAIVMGVVFYTDYRYRKIYNPLVLIVLLLGVYQHHDISIVNNMLFAFVVFLPFFLMGLGGGDFKLMVALAALLGALNSFMVYLIGSVLCLIYITIKKLFKGKEAFKTHMRETVFSTKLSIMGQTKVAGELTPGERIPLGCWLAIGYYIWLGIISLGGICL